MKKFWTVITEIDPLTGAIVKKEFQTPEQKLEEWRHDESRQSDRPASSRPHPTAFAIFEPHDINYATVVYSKFVHVDRRLALIQLLGPRRATWLRKRRKQRSQRRRPRRKRSNRSTKVSQDSGSP